MSRRVIKRRIRHAYSKDAITNCDKIQFTLAEVHNGQRRETVVEMDQWSASNLHDMLQDYFKQRRNRMRDTANWLDRKVVQDVR